MLTALTRQIQSNAGRGTHFVRVNWNQIDLLHLKGEGCNENRLQHRLTQAAARPLGHQAWRC